MTSRNNLPINPGIDSYSRDASSAQISIIPTPPSLQQSMPRITKKSKHRRRRHRSRSNSAEHECSKHAKIFSNANQSRLEISSASTQNKPSDSPTLLPLPRIESIIIHYPNGARYEGFVLFTQDSQSGKMIKQRHGHGIYIDDKYNCHEGLWKHDLANGHGVKEYVSGDRHEGGYTENERSGWGK